MKKLLIFVLCLPLSTFSGEAEVGVAADSVSTGISLVTTNAAEMNPLGWATVPIRLVAIDQAKKMSPEEGKPVLDAVSATSWGATTNNLLVLTGAGTVAPVFGLVVGYIVWQKDEDEREFLRQCAIHKKLDPEITKCEFSKSAVEILPK